MKQGRIVILSGPSGAGKTSLHEKILSLPTWSGRLVRSLSATTRPRRPGEVYGRDYLFLSEKMFKFKIRAGHFLEWEKVFRDYYGTPHKAVRDFLRQGRNVLLCIDVKGAAAVKKKCPDALRVFVKTPDLRELKRRLTARGTEPAKALSLRLQTAKRELAEAKAYEHVVVNDDLARAARELADILRRELS